MTPEREIERLKRLAALTKSSLDTTHPPTVNRIEFLNTHSLADSKFTLSPELANQLEKELSTLQEWMQKQVFQLDSISFRQLFGLSW